MKWGVCGIVGVEISYMGTKRRLAPAVAEVVGHAQSGAMLDVFSGMCSVGEAVAPSRQVWGNDLQVFASTVAHALLKSKRSPLSALECADMHFDAFQNQKRRLTKFFSPALQGENALLDACSYREFLVANAQANQALEAAKANCRIRSPHLFSITYAGNYFGVSQAIEADSIVAAIRSSARLGKVNADEARWCTIALGRALLRISNSPGHFAQYLKPKSTNFYRYLRLRRRSLWSEWLSSIAVLAPIGTQTWRGQNRVFNQDATDLLKRLARSKVEVGVVYADPPYTRDQYSRFYHILETLCLYDYPPITHKGLYRTKRHQTEFCSRTAASSSISKLIHASAKLGADLIISYPRNGIADLSVREMRGLIGQHYRSVDVSFELTHHHSTFGASNGSANTKTTELIYFARST
jgi:adenine-specific DNA-methyltransferase